MTRLVSVYLTIGIVFGIATFILIQFANPTLPSIQRCLDEQAEIGGVSATSRMPSVLYYSAYKGLLWPVSLYQTVIAGDVGFFDWLLARYDPFEDACRQTV